MTSVTELEKCPLLLREEEKEEFDEDDVLFNVNIDSDDNTLAAAAANTTTNNVNALNVQNNNNDGNKSTIMEKLQLSPFNNGGHSSTTKSKSKTHLMKSPTGVSASSSAPSSPTYAGGSGIVKDFNKNFLDAQKSVNCQKDPFRSIRHRIWPWGMLQRKLMIVLLGFALLIIYVNSSLLHNESDERISVFHYSHVPGMKEGTEVLKTSSSNGKLQKLNVATMANTKKSLLKKISKNKSKELPKKKTKNLIIKKIQPNATPTVVQRQSNITVATTIGNAAAAADTFASSAYATTNETVPVFATVLTTVSLNNFSQPSTSVVAETTQIPPGYLVWSERCKMPNIDPYLPEVMEFFERQKYEPCSLLEPLTDVIYDEEKQRYILRIIRDRMGMFSKTGKIDCCYQSIERNGTGKSADAEVWHSKCIGFRNETPLAPTIDNILVKCKDKGKQVYINGHAMMPERQSIRDRLNSWKAKEVEDQPNATSVLMIGIDSISRINLIRAMPKTAQYLYDNEWFEMSGYNKIDDNTFPNLMAVLIGLNKTNALKKCPPTVVRGLDNCPFIWNTFRDHGYVTAYAEDEASINTFNYLKVGFERPPVDYYLRPFLLSAEKHLHLKLKSNLIQCIGFQNSADYVYNYALELATRYKNDPYFGLFWMNTFSHNAISDCSAMDGHVLGYLKKLSALGTLSNTIVIFFSDHGLRFGPTRKTLSGHLEERLPFMFIWLPAHLKQSHPEFVNALSVNKNRLTNPYDLHMTLKHVVALSKRVTDQQRLAPAADCPRCQTLFAPVPHNRSCDDIAIEDHWCTCIPYQSVYKNSKNVQKMAQFIVESINEFVSTFHNATFVKLCQPLRLATVDTAYRARHSDNKSENIYRINIYTAPNQGLFEATIRHNTVSGEMQVTGEISRLNAYVKDSHCVSDGAAKKYCSCRK